MSRLGRVPPSFGRDVIDRKACFLSLLAQAAVWLLELRVSRTFLCQLRSPLFRPWIPNSRRHQHFRSSLGAFCLIELRVFSTFLYILRLICSDHGYPAQRAAKVGRGHPRFLGARKWAPPSAPIRRSVSGSTQRGKVCTRRKETRSARVSRPRRSVKLVRRGSLDPAVRSTVGLQVTRLRSGTGRPSVAEDGRGRRPLPEPVQQFSPLPPDSLATDHWPLFPLTSFREPGTPRP